MADPAPRDPEFQFTHGPMNHPIKVYTRDYMQEFLDFLKEDQQKGKLEVILYTSGVPEYTNRLLDYVDPKREIFKHCLYQGACYILEKKDEDLYMLLKDVARFRNRDMKRSILIDPQPLNFLLNPENGLPCVQYNAELDLADRSDKDGYLIALKGEIENLMGMEDVRPYLEDQYKIRSILKNAKLI